MIQVMSPEFLRSVILLLLGALLTGILVPSIKAIIDWTNAKRQKLLEAQLQRQKELIDAQIGFLVNFSDLSWKLIFEIFKVSYAFAWESEELQKKVYEEYGPKSWELLCMIRAAVSAGTRLSNPVTLRELKDFYSWLIDLDDRLCEMADDRYPQQRWQTFHKECFDEAGQKVDLAISLLSKDLNLSVRNSTA